MKKPAFLILAFLGVLAVSFGQQNPRMRYEDKIRIREAITISNQFGDPIWKGINDIPFVVLLVTDSVEFLINHPYPSDDFKLSENDSLLKTRIFYRARRFPNWYLATFPAVNGVNCIVVGTPENTGKKSTDWTITLLHEHFHQYEYSYPDYFQSVDKLGLSGGDQTGMWQLNYAFPYDSLVIVNQYKKYTGALQKALLHINGSSFKKDFRAYFAERNKFKKLLNEADYRYFSFQIWQEGIARYTEYKFLQALDSYTPSKEMAGLNDFISFPAYKEEFWLKEKSSLIKLKLEVDKRVCFYAIGFSEGLLLDKLNPDWRNRFLTDKFFIEKYFKK
ncbi:MAG: hypothetical protein BGO54_07690 [Sphingobacteriales bacterium 46-32]|nr:MAG: hypothetical protein BGO54_07690 [Sphingobacteriales bacterium 46-32]